MEWVQVIAAVGTILVSLITLVGSIYGIMKFLLKDVTKTLEKLEKEQAEFRSDMRATNARMDRVYHLMLEGKYDLARKKLNEK